MPIAVSCPECGKAYQLPEESLGRKATCKSCGNAFRVQTGADAPQSIRSVAEAVSGSKSRISSSDTLPAQIGRFQILDKLGAGAFGTVYKAYDPVLEREVAVKVPNPGLLSSERDKQRYLREPKAAGQLHHPNIVPVFEASLDGDNIFIVSAFIKGRTLEKAIEEKRPDLRRAATLVMKLARALQYAHENGIVHRDVKPANIMLDAKGEPLLMDFGLARIQESAEKLTMNEAVLGTPAYMSPEQASHNNENVGPASDQYSLGVILFEMLCGQRPFSGPAAIVMSLVIKQEPPAPRSFNPKLPRDLETICLKAMAKEPKKRFADCQEFADDLERWLQDEPITARRTTIVERGIRWSRRNPLVAALTSSVGALLFLVAIVSSFAAVRLDQERQRADLKADEAQHQAELSKEKEAQVAKERDRTKEESHRAHQNYYFAQMSLARNDWDSSDLGNLMKRLEQTKPEMTGGFDFRGFEWAYWNRRANRELFRLPKYPRTFYERVKFSPDGTQILTISRQYENNTVLSVLTAWDSVSAKPQLTLTSALARNSGFVDFVQTDDGKIIVTGDHGGTIDVWNTGNRKKVLTFKAHEKSVESVAISADKQRIVTTGIGVKKKELKVWDSANGKLVHLLVDNVDSISDKHIVSPDGKFIRCCFGGKLGIWNASTGESLQAPKLPFDSVFGFSNDGRKFLGHLGSNLKVKVWDSVTGNEFTFAVDEATRHVEFSSDCKTLIKWGGDNRIELIDSSSGSIHSVIAHAVLVQSADVSPDGQRIVSVGDDVDVKVWDEAAAQTTRTFHNLDRGDVYCVSFSPDGRHILSANYCGIKTLELKSGSSKLVSKQDLPFTKATYVSNGRMIAAQNSNSVRVIDAEAGNDIVTFSTRTAVNANPNNPDAPFRVTLFAANADGRWIATRNNWEMTSTVFDAVTGKEKFKLPAHIEGGRQRDPTCLAFSPDGRNIVSLADFASGKVWDVKSGQEVMTINATRGKSWHCVAYSADGLRIAASGAGAVYLWDSRTGEELLVYRGHSNWVRCLAFSPDGGRIVSASDKSIRLWDTVTGQDGLVMNEHTATVNSVAFSADGRKIVSGSADGTIKVWDATNRE